MRKFITIPNILTCLRIIGTCCLFFVEPLSVSFFAIYTASGITDVLDGTISRATKSTSELGAKLDSAADLLYYAVMLFILLRNLIAILPIWIWIGVIVVTVMRLFSYITVAVKYHTFSSKHNYLNKLTGFMIFCVPYVLKTNFMIIYSCITVIVAFVAALYEINSIKIFKSKKGNSK